MLVINQLTVKGVTELLKNEAVKAACKRAVTIKPNGNLKCHSLTWLAKEHKALFNELTPKGQAKVLKALGGQTLKEALEQTAIKYVQAVLAKQQKTMHPAKHALLLLVYAYAGKQRFESYRFYKQARNIYKLYCFLSEATALKICKAYSKQSNNYGYKAVARKSNSLHSELYHVVLIPL